MMGQKLNIEKNGNVCILVTHIVRRYVFNKLISLQSKIKKLSLVNYEKFDKVPVDKRKSLQLLGA